MKEDQTKTAGIVMDNYKVSTFRKLLKDAGFKFTATTMVFSPTTVFRVEYKEEDLAALTGVVKTANAVSQGKKP